MPHKKGSPLPPLEPSEILNDYRLAYQSRQVSLIGRREVLSGKAKFGIFGDGKELANIAIARAFRKGDWRSGYYRDQTWMFMLGVNNIQEFFAQLYAHADVEHDPSTAGRGMNAAFSNTPLTACEQAAYGGFVIMPPLDHEPRTTGHPTWSAVRRPTSDGGTPYDAI